MVSQWRSSVNLHNWNTLEDHWKTTGISPVAFQCTLGSKFQTHWIATGRPLAQGKGFLLEHQVDMYNLIPGSVWKCRSLYIRMGESLENKWRYEMAAILSGRDELKVVGMFWMCLCHVECCFMSYQSNAIMEHDWSIELALTHFRQLHRYKIEFISLTPGSLNIYSWRVDHCVCHEKQSSYIPQVLNHGYSHLQAPALTRYITVWYIIYLPLYIIIGHVTMTAIPKTGILVLCV